MQTNTRIHNTEQKEGDVMNNNPNRGNSRKEKKMNVITKTTPLAVLVALGLTLTAWAAEPLPLARHSLGEVGYGHKDPVPEQARYGAEGFVPTPEQPVYFRQTYGYYPGATPPLEWWEGTPTTRKGKVKEGTHATTPENWLTREGELGDFADQKSKNILWKVPVPGWSLSHPIVVGKKVFAVGEPDFVTCWDLDTGKQLWQRRIMPLLCDLPAVSTTQSLQAGGLPEEKAAAGQKVLDLARAFFYISAVGMTAGQQHNSLFRGWNRDGTPANPDHAAFVAEKKAMAQKLLDAFAPHRPEVEAFGNAALLAALDKDLEVLRRFQSVTDLEALKALMGDGKQRPTSLIGACLKVLGVGIGGVWWGHVGTADSTLASDGQRIYGVFDQGQVFALDLDGKIVWVQREKGHHHNAGTFHRSPLLCGDLLLVRSVNHKGSIRPLRALDVKTGQVRWEAALAGSQYTVPRLMRLAGADGKPVDVLIGDVSQSKDQGLAVLRVRDGKLLGCLPPHNAGRGAVMAVFGQQVTWCANHDAGPLPNCSYRLRLEGAGTVVAEKVFVLDGKERVFRQMDFPTLAGTVWMCSGDSRGSLLRDGTTGALISKAPVANSFGVVAGHYLITLAGGDNNTNGRCRDDRMASGSFMVTDIKDPAKPVVVARNNLLGYKEPAADLIVSTYFKDFDPFDFAGCYRGSASYFMQMGGPVPAGDKLLIQSSAFMYCIGHREASGPQVGEK